MKAALLFFLLFSYSRITWAQMEDHALMKDNKLIRQNRVKEIRTYYYYSKKDSSLSYVHTYNSAGKLQSMTQYTRKGKISSRDTCFYDINQRLVKRWSYHMYDKRMDESFYFYDSNGVFIRQDYYSNDTLMFSSLPKFDKNGRMVGGKLVDGKTDSASSETFSVYDSLPHRRVFILKQANGDSSISLMDYDSFGNIIRNQTTSKKEPVRISTSVYQYDSPCGFTEQRGSNELTSKQASITRYKYLPNCLVYEREQEIEGITGRFRSYYSYYKE